MKKQSEKQSRIEEAAARALKEAEDRRLNSAQIPLQTELGGRDGPDPIRYGDWEKKGIISDF